MAISGSSVLRLASLSDLDQAVKGVNVGDGKLSEHLAVDLDASVLQTVDETVVGHALGTGSSIDALDPQRAEVALLSTTVTERISGRMEGLLLGLAVQARALTTVTGGLIEDLTTLLLGIHRTLHACHSDSPWISRGQSRIGSRRISPNGFGGTSSAATSAVINGQDDQRAAS